jgi:glycosyltransferase involved in cell wall biosynthesis
MRVTVCIPSTRAPTLGRAMMSISRQTYAAWELLVVVQGTDAAVATAARKMGGSPRCRIVSVPKGGLSRARNAALRLFSGDILAMIDDDCEAAADWLAVLTSCFQEDPEVGLVGGALLAPSNAHGALARCPALTPADATYDPASHRDRIPPGWDWIGGNFAISRWAADRVGEFDECLGAGADFPASDDTDYKLRLEEQGIRMRSTPKALVHHTFGTRRGLAAVLRLQRNYASGNGGLAGKLSLRGDPRGRQWLNRTWQQFTTNLGNPTTAHQAPRRLLHWAQYHAAYSRCVRDYEIDASGFLRRRRSDQRRPYAVPSDG